jgi:uncharacterized protein (DUF2267 family)
MMRYASFIRIVEQTAGISREEAEKATEATLRTLSERITGGEASDLAAFLPEEVRPWLTWTAEPAEAFDFDEFLDRIAQREGVDRDTAFEHARAVLQALSVAVAPGELFDMVAQLPRDFRRLLGAAGIGRRQARPFGDLVGRVAELTNLDRERARRATDVVLETLAVRISPGEVEDIENEIGADLRPALERGLVEHRDAVSMSVRDFLHRVAEREGVDLDEAERHSRTVFTALREMISGKEFHDMESELSDDYASLLATTG